MTRIRSLAVAAVAALGITMTPVPAAADGSDLAKVLGGLAILGIIAKVADDRRDKRREVARQNRFDAPILGSRDRGRIIEGDLRRLDDRGHSVGHRFKTRPLPDRCLRIADTAGRDRLVYVQRCLNRHYKHANRLPDACERLIRTDRGLRTVYGARCLRRDGWQVAQR